MLLISGIVINHGVSNNLMSESKHYEQQQQQQQPESQWADLMGQLFDRLTGKEAVISYGLRNIEVDIPKAAGPQGQNLGSAKWIFNGELVIKAQTNKSDEIER
jgi:hypothetical protein